MTNEAYVVFGLSSKLTCDDVRILLLPEDFLHADLEAVIVARTPKPNAEVSKIIETEWANYSSSQQARGLHGHLTVTQLFRLESVSLQRNSIRLTLSQTDYREIYGTNIRHPEVLRAYGAEFMGNALGLCSVIITRDDRLVLFKRSDDVLEMPGYYHLCAGHFERDKETIGRELDVQGAMIEEICEELGVTREEIENVKPIGLCQSLVSYKPELLFLTRLCLDSSDVLPRKLNFEHKKLMALSETEYLSFLSDRWHTIVPAGKAASINFLIFKHGLDVVLKRIPMCNMEIRTSPNKAL